MGIFLAAALVSLAVGRYRLSIGDLLSVWLADPATLAASKEAQTAATVFWEVRLPRVILCSAVGAALGAAGTTFQGLFRNPLVSPDILGVSAGAGFGAALAITLGAETHQPLAIPLCAFAFGLAAVAISWKVGSRGDGRSLTTMVVAGVVVSSLFSAALSFLEYIADPYETLPSIIFWTMGGFYSADWGRVAWTLPPVCLGVMVLVLLRWKLNILAAGEHDALSLGLNVRRYQACFIFFGTLVVTSSVSSTGTIAWVGLVVPHLARLVVGTDHVVLMPFSAFMGAGFLAAMDTLARSVGGAEIPISIVTSCIGAPFLGYLLGARRSLWWG
jgi:iron complex transport system permease protein